MGEHSITNANLRLSDVPAPDAPFNAIVAFGYTFDAYEAIGSLEKCGEIANARRNETLTELRVCLFFEQRRWHHFGDSPDDDAVAYQRDLVRQIRAKVGADERS